MIEYTVLSVCAFLLIFYLVFLQKIHSGLGKLKYISKKNITNDFISIIIPFRNERENLLNNLRALEALNYPEENFEILYINDSSTDDSVEILKKNITNKNIKILNVPDDFSPNAHKKRAIRFGISNSKGKIIITANYDELHE